MGPERGLLLRCGRLFDSRRGALTGPAGVLIEGGTIVSVAEDLAAGGARVVDLRDCTLLPGLFDLDAELLPGPVAGDSGLWLFQALALAGDLLRRGVTTARVLGGGDERWSLLDLRRAVAEGLAPGAELIVAPHRLDDQRPAAGLARAASREMRNGADWIAVDRRAIDAGLAQEVLREAAGTPLAVAAETAAEVRCAVDAGARSVEVSCALDRDTARMATEHGAFIVPRDGFAVSAPHGLRLCFGGRLTGGLTTLASMVGGAAALAAATSTSARCVARDDRGAIRAGQRADLVAVAGDPLADLDRVGEPTLVVKHGEICR